MSEGLDAQGRIEIDYIVKGLDTLISQIGKLNEANGFADKSVLKLESDLNKVQSRFAGVSGSVDGNTKSAQAASTAWNQQDRIYNDYLSSQEKGIAKQNAAKTATEAHTTSLIAERYALYDVSNTLGFAGLALTAFAALAYKAAINYQSDFATVARTTGVTGAAADALKQSLINISTTLPTTFKDVTGVASLAGQLGIANDQISKFTESVIKFSATTNTTVDAASTAYGRLNALLPDVKGNYDGLGSSILKVGINSLATESQIIGISGRLAGIGSSAGLSSSEVIGLSGALASIGIQPELAQGTITRLFTKIQVAVSQGGVALENFARIYGKSGAQFAAAWKADPTGALTSMLQGINAQGPGAIEAIRGLGLTSARDIPTLLKLAQNTKILTSSLSDASTGMKDGTQLNESYNVIAETTASKLKTLSSNFTALAATAGTSATGLNGLIDVSSGFIKWLDKVIQSPVASTFVGIGLAAAGLGGILLLLTSAYLRTAAAAAAVATAQGYATGSGGILSVAWKVLTKAAVEVTAAHTALGVSTEAVAATSTTAAAAAAAETVSLEGLTGAATAATIATSTTTVAAGKLATSLKFVGVAAVALIGMQVAGSLSDWAFQAVGLTASLTTAGKALDDLDKKRITSDLGLDKTKQKDSQKDPFGSVTGTMYGSLAGRAENPAVAAGQDFNSGIGNVLGLADISNNIKNYDQALAALVSSGNGKKAADDFKFISDGAVKQGATLKQIQDQFPLYGAAVKTAGEAAKSAVPEQEALTQGIKDAIGPITTGVDNLNKIEGALFSLGGTLQAGGNDFSNYSEAGRANLNSLESVMAGYVADAGGNSQELANNLQGLFNALTEGAKVPAASLGILSQAIASLGVGTIDPINISLASLSEGFDKSAKSATKAGHAAGGAAKQIKTLVDYANDLSGVFSRSFDIRFGGQQGFDTITSGWSKISAAIASTNDEIKKYQDTMQSLTADRAVKEYWLSVAENYGDALRAGVLRGELSDLDTQLAQNASDLTKAQDKNSQSLVGNTDGAIANRAQVLGLVQNYQSYIATLASSGLSQADLAAKTAQLKQDFIAQATQLGFNSNELQGYAASFDDVAKAINGVPRKITIDFNPDPAIQALNEFAAKARTAGSAAGAGFGSGLADAVKNNFQAQMARNPIAIDGYLLQGQQVYRVPGTSLKMYSEGGYTGPGNKYDVAGVVHRDEFVFTKEQTSSLGVNNLEALARGQKMPAFTAPAPASSSSGFVAPVELSPYDRALLQNIADRIGITITGTALQNTVGTGNVNSNNRGAA